MRIICSIQKSDVLCFQILLSFVPTIFVFSALCRALRFGSSTNHLWQGPAPRLASIRDWLKHMIKTLVLDTKLVSRRFVLKLTSFVFNNFLALFPLFLHFLGFCG